VYVHNFLGQVSKVVFESERLLHGVNIIATQFKICKDSICVMAHFHGCMVKWWVQNHQMWTSIFSAMIAYEASYLIDAVNFTVNGARLECNIPLTFHSCYPFSEGCKSSSARIFWKTS